VLYYLLKRLFYTLPIALGVTLIVFMLVHLAPGDPLNAVVPADAPADVVESLRHAYGFDKPLPIQYFMWLGRVVTGDLGKSIATGRPVAGEIGPAILNTLMLAVAAAFIGFSGGTLLGGIAGFTQGRAWDKLTTGLAITGVSIPHYWLGIVLVIFFSVELNLLPAMGMGPGGSSAWAWDWLHARHLVLPVVTLSVIPLGVVARTTRSCVAEILNQEFVQTLHAKGLLNQQVVAHVVKNAAPVVLAVIGLQLGYLLGGSILVETVFSWPGAGFLMNDAIFRRDLPLLQGTILTLALFFVLLNLVVDLIQTMLNPRIRRG
jgi:peptide/nickel transport system permease protein